MTLFEQLTNDLKDAMRAGNTLKRDVMRSLITMVKNEAIAHKCSAIDMTDEMILAVIKRAKKQRDDASVQYKDGGRVDLAQKEAEEAEIIARYLPEQMSEDAIVAIIDTVIKEVGTDKKNFGIIMKRVMTQTRGQADGAVVKRLVDEKLV